MYSGRGNTPSRVLGFPIRTSADQHLVDSSPQLFAVTHVLHRFLAPRHPPLALCSLEEQRCSCLLCSSQRALTERNSALAHHRPHWQRSGPRRSRRSCLGDEGNSLKTEEKTKPADSNSSGGRILRHLNSRRPTHQCTNWELVRTGLDRRQPSIEQCSLERR